MTTPQISRHAVLARLHEAAVIAVLRAPTGDAALRAVDALVRGGVTAIEITYSTPDVAEVLRRVAADYGGAVVLGAGTLTRLAQVDEATGAGAEFLVSPGLDDDVHAAMRRTGLTTLVGAFTPTEVMRVRRLGADAVKLFPASTGGPGHLLALRGPFSDLTFVPTGGVSASNVGQWLDAGAYAVGAAGSLCPAGCFNDGDFEPMYRRAIAFTDAVRQYRGTNGSDTGTPTDQGARS